MGGPILNLLVFLAAQDIRLPSIISGGPGEFIPIKAETAGKVVRFVGLDQGLSVFPSGQLVDSKSTVVVALKAGRYRLLAYSAINETPTDPVIVIVAVGENPEPPQPVDGLAQALQSIYGAIQEPGRAQTVAELAKIYRAFAANPQGKTLAEVFQKMKAAGQSIKGCQALRERIADHLDLALGVAPGMEIDSNLSAKIKAEFKRIAQILEGLK